MSTVDFNSLIYTASKSLRTSDVVNDPSTNKDINHLLQDKMMLVVKHKEAFKLDLSIKAWFNIISSALAGSVEVASIESLSPDLIKETSENKEIKIAVNKLDESIMTPFVMHFQGFKYEEIAEKLNLSVEIIKTRIEIARNFLVSEIK